MIISHNEEFVTALCTSQWTIALHTNVDCFPGPEIWNVEAGRLTHKGKAAVVEDAFAVKSPKGSGANTPVRSRLQTPAGSTAPTPAGSGAEDKPGTSTPPVKKKKKLTSSQVLANVCPVMRDEVFVDGAIPVVTNTVHLRIRL